jgi:capsular polysaccharide biosynthesis protein
MVALGSAGYPRTMKVPDVYRALWRHKVLIVVMTAWVTVGAWYLTSRQPPTYQASSLVRIQQKVKTSAEAFAALQTGQRLAQTYARITTTLTIAEAIETKLGGVVPLREIDLAAAQVDDLDLLTISASHRDPKRAQLIANVAPSAVRDFIQRTGTLNEEVILVQLAAVPASPSAPRVKLNVAVALLLGLIFNAALALLLEAVADRLSDPDSFERLAGKPVLATVPVLSFADKREPIANARAPG